MFSNAVTQFLQVIQPILSRTCFLAYNSELCYSGKKTNRGCWRHTFLKKSPGIFRLVSLPLEIPNKMKLHLWKFHQIVPHTLQFQRSKTKTHGNFTLFFCLIKPGNSTSFFIDSWSFQILFFQPPGNSMSSTPPLLPLFVFFWNSPEVVTDSQTKICKFLIQQSTRFVQRAPKPYCLTFVLVLCQPWQPCNNESADYRLNR